MACLVKSNFLFTKLTLNNQLFAISTRAFRVQIHEPPPSGIANKGSTYNTRIERKRKVPDPNRPNFEKATCLQWANWWMLRDLKKRIVHCDYTIERYGFQMMGKSLILPRVITEDASAKLKKLPHPCGDSWKAFYPRCIISGRARTTRYGLLGYRIGRHAWRALADANQLSGVIKSCWGP